MLDFINQRKKAGILAAALGISALVSGCGSSKPNAGNPGVPAIPPAIESPVETENPNTGLIDEKKVDFNKVDKAYVEEATEEVMDYYEEEGEKARPFWLDIELLTKEVAYAKSLIDAYEKDMCPGSIKEEVALLVEINNMGFASATTFPALISAFNTLYNGVANIDALDFETSVVGYLSSLNAMISPDVRKLDEYALKYYKLAKVIHEACCEEDHSIKNSEGYNYCMYLEEANEILYDDYDKVYSLRLTK